MATDTNPLMSPARRAPYDVFQEAKRRRADGDAASTTTSAAASSAGNGGEHYEKKGEDLNLMHFQNGAE